MDYQFRQSPLNINPSGPPVAERRRKGRRDRRRTANKNMVQGAPGMMNEAAMRNAAVLQSLGFAGPTGGPPEPQMQLGQY